MSLLNICHRFLILNIGVWCTVQTVRGEISKKEDAILREDAISVPNGLCRVSIPRLHDHAVHGPWRKKLLPILGAPAENPMLTQEIVMEKQYESSRASTSGNWTAKECVLIVVQCWMTQQTCKSLTLLIPSAWCWSLLWSERNGVNPRNNPWIQNSKSINKHQR